MGMTAESLRGALSFRIDLKNGLMQQAIRSQLMKGDRQANTVVIQLTEDGIGVDLSGVGVTGSFISPEGGAEIPLEGKAEGSIARVTLIDECYAAEGYFELDVKLTIGKTTRTILAITGQVLSKGSGAILDVGNVIPSIDELLAQIAVMRETTEAAKKAADEANEAAEECETQAENAKTAASNANLVATQAALAAGNANGAAAKIDGMTVSAQSGSAAGAKISEMNGAKHILFTLPKGNTGATPDITFKVVTGEAGTDVQVSQSGTPEAPVVTLTIPRGTPGEGAVDAVCGVYPDTDGNVPLTASDVGALPISGGNATGPVSAQKLTSWTDIRIKSGSWAKVFFQDASNGDTGRISSYADSDGNGNMSFAVFIPGTSNQKVYRLPAAKSTDSALTKYILTTESPVTIEQGGTGKTSRKDGFNALAFLGLNPVSSTENDTPSAWNTLGTGYARYNTAGQLNDQPETYGLLVNYANSGDVFQIWSGSSTYFRCGSSNGWSNSWRKVYDTNNKPTAADIGALAANATAADSSKLGGVDASQYALKSEAYSLPTASASVLGGVKIGSGLEISNGVLSNKLFWQLYGAATIKKETGSVIFADFPSGYNFLVARVGSGISSLAKVGGASGSRTVNFTSVYPDGDNMIMMTVAFTEQASTSKTWTLSQITQTVISGSSVTVTHPTQVYFGLWGLKGQIHLIES